MSSVAYNCPRLLRQSNLFLLVLGGSRTLPSCPSHTAAHAVQRIPWTLDPPFMSLSHSCLEDSLDIPGFLGHPVILPSCSLRHRPPCCPEDPFDIPGSSLGVPSDTGPRAFRRIPWTSRDPPLVNPQMQAPMLSGGSLGVPSDTGPPGCPGRGFWVRSVLL